MTLWRWNQPARLLAGQSGQAMAEYSFTVFALLILGASFSGAHMMKWLIESLTTYFQAYYYAIRFVM